MRRPDRHVLLLRIMADEKENKQPPQPQPQKVVPSNIPQVKEPDPIIDGDRSQPLDSEYSGLYKHRVTGQPAALSVQPANRHGNTHHLKNSANYWQLTEEQFRVQFDKA
jgi:hypothetical protein